MKTLIGIVSYGGIRFLELALRGIQETVKSPDVEVMVVIAKPGDAEMEKFLSDRDFPFIVHQRNIGFPASINDLYEHAFEFGTYSNLICMGNDVIPMPGAIDSMIEASRDWEIVCASEFNSRFLVDNYPKARQYFHGENLVFDQFESRPWELHQDYREGVEPNTLKDVRNLTLFRRSSFEKAGYADVNFWPNGYWEDCDYCRRCNLLGVQAAGLKHAAFFHFWSRTIFQGERRPNNVYFQRNEAFYRDKWGGLWNSETYRLPFNGENIRLPYDVELLSSLRIRERNSEEAIIKHWSSL